jgi:histidine triad (HIT) family protein
VTADRCCRHDTDPDSCEACYAEDVASALAPVVSLGEALAELEATDPEVKAVVEPLDREQDRQLRRMRRQEEPRPCPFCAIVAGTAPADIVRDWPDAIAFRPLNPVSPGHVLVIPKRHEPTFRTDVGTAALTMARAAELAADIDGDVNLITSAGPAATQTVFHLHIHLVPRSMGDGLALPWTA